MNAQSSFLTEFKDTPAFMSYTPGDNMTLMSEALEFLKCKDLSNSESTSFLISVVLCMQGRPQ